MRGAVTASTREAADAGAAILRDGGNAIDAAVAAALATCVADPCNTGIGGYGGYLLVHRPGEAARCVQFPLRAPSNRPPDRLAVAYPEAGPACSSVPNVVSGLALALARFGRFSWPRVSAPAIALARDGVVANATNALAFEEHRGRPFVAECFELEDAAPDTVRFRQPRLADTLDRMAVHGPDWFYRGPLALAARSAWQAAGVDMPLADWTEGPGAAEVVAAASFEAGGVRLHAAPLGLSGSACVFAFFAAAVRLAEGGAFPGATGLAELARAMARVWQYRFAMPSGNDFAGIDLARWIDEALRPGGACREAAPEASHTGHLNVVDEDGMVVALTFTQGPAWFGGRWSIPGTGVVMNGGMHNFSRSPPLRHGGRWYGVSNMTPTSAVGPGGERVAVGCPGARRIPGNVALVLARHFLAGESLQSAVSGGRLHTEDPERVHWESGRLDDETRRALEARFAAVEPEDAGRYFGPLSAVGITEGGAIDTAVDDRLWKAYAAHAH